MTATRIDGKNLFDIIYIWNTDKIRNKNLVNKLKRYLMGGKILKITDNFLQKRSFRFRLEASYNTRSKFTAGSLKAQCLFTLVICVIDWKIFLNCLVLLTFNSKNTWVYVDIKARWAHSEFELNICHPNICHFGVLGVQPQHLLLHTNNFRDHNQKLCKEKC